MIAAIALTGLRKSFGRTEIIRGVDLEVERGRIHAIIGPNGAGKSTLFDLISGRLAPSAGRIALNGTDITGRAPYEIVRHGLARSFQVTNVFHRMSVFENIRCAVLWSRGYGYSFWTALDREPGLTREVERILEETGLTDRRDVDAGLLAYSDQRALEIAITLATGAQVILLDEPTAGMSRSETEQATRLIERLARDRTMVIVEHDMGVVFDLAATISVLVHGEIIATGTPARIRADTAVREAYLGTEAL